MRVLDVHTHVSRQKIRKHSAVISVVKCVKNYQEGDKKKCLIYILVLFVKIFTTSVLNVAVQEYVRYVEKR